MMVKKVPEIEVIAKAYGDRPLWRLCASCESKRVYVLNPSLKNSPDPLKRLGVGFPKSSVFMADPALFAELESAYRAGDQAKLLLLWDRAEQFDPAAMMRQSKPVRANAGVSAS